MRLPLSSTRFCLGSLMLLLIVALAGCGSDLTEKKSGQLTVDEPSVNFTAVAVGPQLQVETFHIQNTSNDTPLTIFSAELITDSPYLSMGVGGEERLTDELLDPFGARQVDIRYSPEDPDLRCPAAPTELRSEFKAKCSEVTLPEFLEGYCGHVEVISDDANAANRCAIIPVYIATTNGRIQVDPQTLEFDSVVAGESRVQSQEFLVENIGTNQLRLKGFTFNIASTSSFSVEGDSDTATILPGGMAAYTVNLMPGAEDITDILGTLTIKSDDPTNPTETITLRVGSAGGASVEVTPNSIDFPETVPPDQETRTVTVTNTGEGAPLLFTIGLQQAEGSTAVVDYEIYDEGGQVKAGPSCEGVSSDSPCRTQVLVIRGESHVLSVVYKPQDPAGSDAILVIRPQGLSVYEIALSGQNSAGSVSVSPTSIDLVGPADVVGEVTDTITLTNNSALDVEVTDISLSNTINPPSCDHFVVTPPTPQTITATSQLDLTVTFTRPNEAFPIEHQCDVNITAGGVSSLVTLSISYP